MNHVYLLVFMGLLFSAGCGPKRADEPAQNAAESYKVLKRPDSLLVLANDHELWAFIKFTWFCVHPEASSTSSRKWMGFANEQFVLTHDGTKWSPVTVVPTYQGPTIHENITVILPYENRFLAWSTNYPLHQWTGKKFEPMKEDQADKILESLGATSTTAPFQIDQLAKKSMAKSGWTVLHQSRSMMGWTTNGGVVSDDDVTFQWKNKQFYVFPKGEGKKKELNLVEKESGNQRTWTPVVEYSNDPFHISKQEYEKLNK